MDKKQLEQERLARLDRLEVKVDKVEETVVEIKTDLKHYNAKVEEHLTSDAGIIKKISPILQKLPQIVEIAEEYQYNQKKKEKRNAAVKSTALYLGVIATVVGILSGLSKLI